MKISILTATYNRAKYLNVLYKSIVNNISSKYEVEWLIMDDGSVDDTEDVCNKLVGTDKSVTSLFGESRLQIKYFKQENQGKMAAINNLSEYVTGDLWIECDSDDFFVENCFSKIVDEYEKISDRNDIYALAFLKQDLDGNNMGNNFKNEISTMYDLYFKEQEDGEKALVFVTNIRKNYRYELEHNERFVTEARMYHKMDKDYKIKCINETIMVCEYQAEGYSKNINKQFISNPFGYYKYFYEILADMDTKNIDPSKRMYVIKHYILFTYLAKKRLCLKVRGLKNKLLILLLYIPGTIKSIKYKRANKI